MCAQPSRQGLGAAADFGVEAYACHAAEIAAVWRGRPARDCQRCHNSQVDPGYIVLSRVKSPPRHERIADASQSQGAGEIVATSGRNNKKRKSKFYQLVEMAVNGAVAAEDQDNVGLVCGGRHSDPPVDAVIDSERIEVFRRTSQPEDGGGAHVRG